jgi:sulfate transport system substrate-binding protein
MKKLITGLGLLLGLILTASAGVEAPVSLLNVSYDPTRELYQQYNAAFAKHWKEKTGSAVVINQSHGGSGSQAHSVIGGLEADVVTLALAPDIDALHNHGDLVPADWQSRLPDNSSPYTSAIVLLVRQGDPKAIKDWDDLVKPGAQIITPNPKTSGGARWSFLAAWTFARKKFGGDEGAKKFVANLYQHAPDLAAGARGSTTTFVGQGIGDVLIAWENEALLVQKQFGSDKFEIVVPSLSILAEPPVAWVDKVVATRGTRDVAREYLAYLYSEEGQNIIADNFYRRVCYRLGQDTKNNFRG